MSTRQQTELSGTNQFAAAPVCDHCAGVTSHETWCITCNAIVRYAYAAVMDGSRRLSEMNSVCTPWGSSGPPKLLRQKLVDNEG